MGDGGGGGGGGEKSKTTGSGAPSDMYVDRREPQA